MASQMIGRTVCPECGFASAHVKQSEKCLHRYCPECNSQYFAKTPRQQNELKEKTRMSEPATATGATASGSEATATATATGTAATATPAGSEATATATATDIAPPKRRGLFS